ESPPRLSLPALTRFASRHHLRDRLTHVVNLPFREVAVERKRKQVVACCFGVRVGTGMECESFLVRRLEVDWPEVWAGGDASCRKGSHERVAVDAFGDAHDVEEPTDAHGEAWTRERLDTDDAAQALGVHGGDGFARAQKLVEP